MILRTNKLKSAISVEEDNGKDCIRDPPRGKRDWKIHHRRPKNLITTTVFVKECKKWLRYLQIFHLISNYCWHYHLSFHPLHSASIYSGSKYQDIQLKTDWNSILTIQFTEDSLDFAAILIYNSNIKHWQQ